MTIQSIREALEKISPWPWELEESCNVVHDKNYACVVDSFAEDRFELKNTAFIASAPEMIAFLLERVEELEKEEVWPVTSTSKGTIPTMHRMTQSQLAEIKKASIEENCSIFSSRVPALIEALEAAERELEKERAFPPIKCSHPVTEGPYVLANFTLDIEKERREILKMLETMQKPIARSMEWGGTEEGMKAYAYNQALTDAIAAVKGREKV